jgi:hypothetical protein
LEVYPSTGRVSVRDVSLVWTGASSEDVQRRRSSGGVKKEIEMAHDIMLIANFAFWLAEVCLIGGRDG